MKSEPAKQIFDEISGSKEHVETTGSDKKAEPNNADNTNELKNRKDLRCLKATQHALETVKKWLNNFAYQIDINRK